MPLRCLIPFILFLFTAGLMACEPAPSTPAAPAYFEVQSFLNASIKRLEQGKYSLHKTVILNDRQEKKRLPKPAWAKELELFFKGDINKEGYQNAYDDHSEEDMLWYRLKTGEQAPLQKMVIHRHADGEVHGIEMEFLEKNFLFESSKRLHLDFQSGILKTYYIEGKQQIIFLSPTQYKVLGVIIPGLAK